MVPTNVFFIRRIKSHQMHGHKTGWLTFYEAQGRQKANRKKKMKGFIQAGPDCLVAYLSGLGPSLERELYTCIGVVVGREGIVRGVW